MISHDPGQTPSRAERAAEIFEEALLVEEQARSDFLNAACGGDLSLQAELISLLNVHTQAAGFLEPRPDRQRHAANSMKADLPHQPGEMIGHYQLTDVIGEGGFGVVYRAQQHKPVRREVALKVIKLGMDTRQVIARFEAERQALAMMNHPGIAKVFDAGSTQAGRPYFVMELVRGTPITDYCDVERLDTAARLRLFMQVCFALEHAHQKGIIHRDIKPSNILISVQENEPVPKIIDFGIAKATNAEEVERTVFTELRQIVGSPMYMSPEQAGRGEADIDTRADIYSLGVLLYELLTGTTPFDARKMRSASFDEMMRVIREEEPIRPSTRFSSMGDAGSHVAQRRQTDSRRLRILLHGDLDWIVMKCLEKDRTRRYATASALAEDIQRHLDDKPVVARPPSAGYRLRKFVRRYRGAVAAAAVIFLVLTVATAISFNFAWREAAAREREHSALAQALEERQRADREAQESSRQAIAAEAARALAERRASETAQVAEFQANMLRGLDAEALGRSFRQNFRETLRSALERGEENVDDELSMFDRVVGRIQMADVARRVMDESVFARAARTVDESFSQQPLVQAQIRDALAAAYQSLGLYDLAEGQARLALLARQSELGHDHREVAKSMNHLASILHDKGQFAEALQFCREALDIQRKGPGDENLDLAATLAITGIVLQQMGELEQAEQSYRDALTVRRRFLGNQHADVASTLNSLASLTLMKGDLDAAEPMFREALAIQRSALGDSDVNTITMMRDLAVLLSEKGQLHESIALSREVLDVARRYLGNEHPDVAGIVSNLALFLKRRGELEEAEKLYREALAIRQNTLGNQHPDVANTLNNLAVLLRDRGAYLEAEPLYRQAITIQERAFPPGHAIIAISRAGLGRTLVKMASQPQTAVEDRQARLLEARALLEGADHDFLSSADPNSLFVRRCLESLIELYEMPEASGIDPDSAAKAASCRSRLEKLTTPP